MKWRVCAATLCLLLLGGCRSQSDAESNTVSAAVERGPLRLTIDASPRQVLIGDPVRVELRVETPDDYVVDFPAAEALGELSVSKIDTPDARPGVEGGLLWQRTYTVEPLQSGTVEIPALTVKYARKSPGATTQPALDREAQAGPLKLDVLSALSARDNVLDPRDITGTLVPPRKPLPAWAWALIVVGGLLGATLLVLLIRWVERRARRPAPPLAPEVWALRALAELETARLIESDQAREYYYRLSEIVRVYIERQFGLTAPEMTTEEFLLALARDRGAVPYDAERLREFLQACDMVKYAALTPGTQEAAQALGVARAFVDATAAARQGQTAAPASVQTEQAA